MSGLVGHVLLAKQLLIEFDRESDRFLPKAVFAEIVRSAALSAIDIPQKVVHDCQTMAGEDMALYLQKVSGCFFFLGSANLQQGLCHPHHHTQFDFDETVLGMGVEMFLRCVETFCGNAIISA